MQYTPDKKNFLKYRNYGRVWDRFNSIPLMITVIFILVLALLMVLIKFRRSSRDLEAILPVAETPEIIKINVPHPNNYYNQGYRELHYLIKAGDNLADILNGVNNDNNSQTFAILQQVTKYFNLRKVQVGQEISIRYLPKIIEVVDAEGNKSIAEEINIDEVKIRLDNLNQLIVSRDHNGQYLSRKAAIKLKRYLIKNGGTIENGLYVDGVDAGIPASLMLEIIKVYGFDVDFQRDIRKGDSYEMLYEAYYDDKGKLVKYGDILYASLRLRNHNFEIYLFQSENGKEYYDENGHTVRKSLLKTPVNGARISSPFGVRKHPILGYTRMHKGIDFAVPMGTPIFAAGSGTVTIRKYWGTWGNYVRIRHNKDYETEYAHMSRFNPKVVVGTRVRQGQVIGYVGSTGMSTGPHVHLGIIYKGERINPGRVKSVSEVKLTGKRLAKFAIERDQIKTYRKNTPNQNKKYQ